MRLVLRDEARNLAIATDSQYVVSRDKHLLRLADVSRPEARDLRERFPNVAVLQPESFLDVLRARQAST